jgi:heat shock protein HslJ
MRNITMSSILRSTMRTAMLAALTTSALLAPAGTLAASPSPGLPTASSPLVGPEWLLATYVAEDGGSAGPAAPAAIRFDGASVSGDTGCNGFSGPYTADADSLAIGPVAVTARACDPDVAGQEMAVLAALAEVVAYQVDGGILRLLDSSGTARLTYGSLEDRIWVPLFGADEPAPAAIVTLAFLDGTATGQGPCNVFSAPYQLAGTNLVMGPIVTTKLLCPDMGIEERYLAALASTRSWTMDAGDLVLVDELGAQVRRFTAAASDD